MAKAAKFAAMKYDVGFRHLTFVISGWEHFTGFKEPLPVMGLVSNHYMGLGRYSSKTTADFTVHRTAIRGTTELILRSAGQQLGVAETRLLRKRINNSIKNGRPLSSVAEILVNQVLTVSQKNDAVGDRVLAFWMSRHAAKSMLSRNGVVMTAGYSDTSPCFIHFDPKDRSGVQYGPHYVCDGSALKNFEAGPIRN